MTQRDQDEEIDRVLSAMDRDTLDACTIPDRMDGRHRYLVLTPEMEAEGLFVRVARTAAANGRANLVPWLWERYMDGKLLSEARTAASKNTAERMRKAHTAMLATKAIQDAELKNKYPQVIRRVGADLAAGSEKEES